MSNRLLPEEDKKQDIQFYMDQRAEGVGTMSGNVVLFAKRFKKHQLREQKAGRAEKPEEAIAVPDDEETADAAMSHARQRAHMTTLFRNERGRQMPSKSGVARLSGAVT